MPLALRIARFRSRIAALAIVFGLFLFITSARLSAAGGGDAQRAMVVAENALAARAGLDIMRRGGNAVDAAVATSLAVCVTNPVSCGIGGGGFMLIYIAKTQSFYALDYRERAPIAASAKMYFRNGKPDEDLARTGPLAVAVPGELAGLDAALKKFGTMKFSALAAPAIHLADTGFPATSHLAEEVARVAPKIAGDPGMRATFLAAGKPPAAGATITEKPLAATLKSLGDDPIASFYHGPIAARIAAWMKANGGIVTAQDLAAYAPVWRTPLHRGYRGYEVYTMPPPSSAGVVLEILGMLEPGQFSGLGADSPPYLARLIEMMREGFIDRDRYADPAFEKVPIAELLSQQHIDKARDRALHRAKPPPVTPASDHGTTNLLVVDTAGDVVAVTTTINTILGAKVMIPDLGIILNDEMDDFAVAPGVPNAFKLAGAAANEIAPGKRPLSSMSPTIVMRDGHPALAVGGSGGPTIITGVLQVTLNVLDFNMPAEAAVAEPRIHEQASPNIVFVEKAIPQVTRDALAQMGYTLKVVPVLGAVGAIKIEPGALQGAADPRKTGGGVAGM